jgi:threonine synthase
MASNARSRQMFYTSTGCRAPAVSFRDAVMTGLAPDGGLYLPVRMPPLPGADSGCDLAGTAFSMARLFVGDDIGDSTLHSICRDAFSFPMPLIELTPGIHVLELFHGPTLAFKDLGARFLARVMSHFAQESRQRLTILVATSGDTGSAVASGFAGIEAIDVVLLYPAGRVSRLQEQQLTTLGGNVTAVAVQGTFDDCQAMVKTMFADREVQSRRPLSSANSINIGRLLPQVFYWVHAWRELGAGRRRPQHLCVPSGNFGNLTAALIARLMGLPVMRIIAGTNANDVVPRYLASGIYAPQAVVQTPANAMDVGNPSNFARILHLLDHSHRRISELVSGIAVTTPEILATVHRVWQEHGYLLDPHSAVGFAALQRFVIGNGDPDALSLLAATAHPAKFSEAIEEATGTFVEIPAALAAALSRSQRVVKLGNRPAELKELLLDQRPGWPEPIAVAATMGRYKYLVKNV